MIAADRQHEPRAEPANRQTLARAMELTGLHRGAVYTLRSDASAVLGACAGFRDHRPLTDFFGHPELLGEAMAQAGGRIMRLGSIGVDIARARSVKARSGLAFLVLVPIHRAGAPDSVVVLGAPRTPDWAPFARVGHTERVSGYSRLLAAAIGLSSHQCDLIGAAAALHDVGKLTIPEEILGKPGALDPGERELVERHAEHGRRILSGDPNPLCDLAAEIAWTHHERWDGGGYPRGLRGEEIPLAGRMAAIADVFDALTSDRAYRPAMDMDEALELMESGAGSHFDPHLLPLFLRAVARRRAPREPVAPAPQLRLAGAYA